MAILSHCTSSENEVVKSVVAKSATLQDRPMFMHLIDLLLIRRQKLTSFYIAVMADPLEHATGLEKQEMLAKAAGNDVRTCIVFN